MFFLEDDNWRRVRSIVTPTFTLSRLKKVKPLVDDCVDEMINNLNDFIQNKSYGKNTTKTAVNVCQAIEAYSMHVVIQMGYGARVHSIIETNNPVVYSAKEFFSNISRLFTWSFIISEKYLYSVINEHNLSFFKTLALRITSERKRKCARNEEAKRNDFLQLMLDALEKDSSSNSSDDISNFNVCRRDISDRNSSNSEGDFSQNKEDKKFSYDFKTNKSTVMFDLTIKHMCL